jgi:hypothetical protein
LEAGSGRGSIKKSRPAYAQLILDIEAAALKQAETKAEADPVTALRKENRNLAQLLDGALEREAALLSEVYDLREDVRQLREQLFKKGLVIVHDHQNSSGSAWLTVEHRIILVLARKPFCLRRHNNEPSSPA